VGVQEVRWEKGGTERADDYTFTTEKGMGSSVRNKFFVRKGIVSAFRRVEFVSDRMSYIKLRGHWCNIIVLNVQVPCEYKGDDVKDSFCEEQGRVFDQFPRYDMEIVLGDFNTKVGRENICKPTMGNESLHENINDNGDKVLKFGHLKS
jgi:hypothetical protein